MNENRSINTIRNFRMGLINNSLNIFFPFLVRTIVIRELGGEYLGLNGLITSILLVLNMTELGFSNAIIFSLYKPIASNDSNQICSLLNFYKTVYRIVGLSILLLGLFLLPFLDHFITGNVPNDIELNIVYLIFLFNTSISYLLFAYKNSILIAHQRLDIFSNINTIIKTSQFATQAIIILVFKNYYMYIAILPTFTILNNVFTAIVTKKKYPHLTPKGKVDKKEVTSISKKIKGLLILRIANSSRNTFDNIFISVYVGLFAVAVYGNYLYIMTAVSGFLQVINTSMKASIGNSIVTEDIIKNYNDFRKINYSYMFISGWCTICLVCLIQPFIMLWLGSSYKLSNEIVVLLCIYFYALRLGEITGVYNDAAGLWWEQRFRTISEVIANISLNWILAKYFGIYGIVLATCITIIIFGFIWSSVITFKNYFGVSKFKPFILSQVRYFIYTTFAALLTYYCISKVGIENNFYTFIIKLASCAVLAMLFQLLFFLIDKDFKDSKKYILGRFMSFKIR